VGSRRERCLIGAIDHEPNDPIDVRGDRRIGEAVAAPMNRVRVAPSASAQRVDQASRPADEPTVSRHPLRRRSSYDAAAC
jgi:hypothetical protein